MRKKDVACVPTLAGFYNYVSGDDNGDDGTGRDTRLEIAAVTVPLSITLERFRKLLSTTKWVIFRWTNTILCGVST